VVIFTTSIFLGPFHVERPMILIDTRF